ncbi:MAG TPA: arginine--tRNA ligase, partial [Solirubrobacterales bacterium]
APFRPRDGFDVLLVPRVPEWQDDAESRKALEQLESEPWVDAVQSTGKDVWMRLGRNWFEEKAAALEVEHEEERPHADIAGGKSFALNFWDANSTKALHIGHLRNLALGNALGAALGEAGGEVERRSIICDVGRSMGEAMAGVLRSGRGLTAENGEKTDHFVGYCYADYVKAGASTNGLSSDHPADSLTREVDVQNDSADELLLRVLNGDQTALELWSQTRAWVISGQRKTLARLGIAFDRVFFESDFLPEVNELAELGLQEGTLQRRADGTIVYITGREELEEMPLVRSDGVPTQHMRALAYWLAAPGLEVDGLTSIQVCGLEWVAHVTCRRQLMAELVHTEEGNGFHPYHDIFHGMVAKEQEAIKSSKKDALLIDHLIEWIDEQMEADPERATMRSLHPTPERIPAQIALGYFLLHPATKKVNFEPEKLLRDDKSLGWDMLRARVRSEEAAAASNGGDPTEDPDYRFAVVHSEMYRRHLYLVTRRLNPIPLARYASHLARWYLETERSPQVGRVVAAVLDDSTRGLGLEGVR